MEMRKYFQSTEITHQNLQYEAGSRLESSQKKEEKETTGKDKPKKRWKQMCTQIAQETVQQGKRNWTP